MTKMQIEYVGSPGKTHPVNAEKYHAMRTAYLVALPASPPGMTPAEILRSVTPHLPGELFPGGDKAGWWAKAVQLDLEAKGLVKRAATSPVRLWRNA